MTHRGTRNDPCRLSFSVSYYIGACRLPEVFFSLPLCLPATLPLYPTVSLALCQYAEGHHVTSIVSTAPVFCGTREGCWAKNYILIYYVSGNTFTWIFKLINAVVFDSLATGIRFAVPPFRFASFNLCHLFKQIYFNDFSVFFFFCLA